MRSLSNPQKRFPPGERTAHHTAPPHALFHHHPNPTTTPPYTMADQRLAAKRIPGTGFLVDGFRFQATPGVTAFFLTHAHSDHTTGLGRGFGTRVPRGHDEAVTGSPWVPAPLYASPATAALIIHDTPRVDPAAVVYLPLGVATPVPDGEGRPPVVVTALCANHCPGAVVLVFDVPAAEEEGAKGGVRRCGGVEAAGAVAVAVARGPGPRPTDPAPSSDPTARPLHPARIVHTGDFRYHPALAEHPCFSSPTAPRVDLLLLDTTYAAPAHAFPPQADAVAAAVVVMAAEAGVRVGGAPGHPGSSASPLPPPPACLGPLFVVGSYRIGKERFYLGAAAALGWRVWVDRDRADRLRRVGLVDRSGRLMPGALGPAAAGIAHLLLAHDPSPPVLCSDPAAARIHVVPMGGALSPPALRARLAAGRGRWDRVVGIRPTGWAHRGGGGGGRGGKQGGSGGGGGGGAQPPPPPPALRPRPIPGGPGVVTYAIPYSEHSSFSELCAAVAAFRPRTLIPTVGATTPAARATLLARFADGLAPDGPTAVAAARRRVTHYFSRRAEGGAANPAATTMATTAAAPPPRTPTSPPADTENAVPGVKAEAGVAGEAAAPKPPPLKREAEDEADDGWGPELEADAWAAGAPPPPPPPPDGQALSFDLAGVDPAQQESLWAAAVARGRAGPGGSPAAAAAAKRARRQLTLAGFVGKAG